MYIQNLLVMVCDFDNVHTYGVVTIPEKSNRKEGGEVRVALVGIEPKRLSFVRVYTYHLTTTSHFSNHFYKYINIYIFSVHQIISCAGVLF